MLIGAIEAGGTKMVCAIGNSEGEILDRITIPTETPEITMPQMITYFKKYKIEALGIGCFGPVDLDRKSDTYGYIRKTNKAAWAEFDFAGTMERALCVPVGFDTDVNGAVLGEVTWGAAKGLESAIYITVGTGIGVGVYLNGGLVHGLVHPEGGHVFLTRHPEDNYEGCCSFHKNCAEGLASGPAIEGRAGRKGNEISEDDPIWEIEAFYLAQAIADYICVYSPQKIILWGGVMHQKKLYSMIREKVAELLNGYICDEMIQEKMDEYIVEPELLDDPGILGAMKLGMLEIEARNGKGKRS